MSKLIGGRSCDRPDKCGSTHKLASVQVRGNRSGILVSCVAENAALIDRFLKV